MLACTPGQQVSCPCPDGPDGAQACLADGSGFAPCDCEPMPLDDTTTASSSNGTSDDGTSSSESGSSTTGGLAGCDEPPLGRECDPWLQDCPEGEKCMPWANGGVTWNDTRCTPIQDNPGQAGDQCVVDDSSTSGIDDCDLGLVCWNVDQGTLQGVCSALCTGCPNDAVCEDPDTVCVITNGGFLPLCLPTGGCDPLLQDCPEDQACYAVDDEFLCAPGGSGGYGQACTFIDECAPGLVCVDPSAVPDCLGPGCCTELCDITEPAGECSGAPSGQTCQPWYGEGQAPPGYDHVGVCSL